jgi:hypothetical protein
MLPNPPCSLHPTPPLPAGGRCVRVACRLARAAPLLAPQHADL